MLFYFSTQQFVAFPVAVIVGYDSSNRKHVGVFDNNVQARHV